MADASARGGLMSLENMPWSELVATALGSTGLTAAFNWWANRKKRDAYTMGAVDHAVETAMSSVTGQLQRTDERLQAVEKQHAECEANLAKVNLRLDAADREKADLAAEIERLMDGPVAVVGQPAPKENY